MLRSVAAVVLAVAAWLVAATLGNWLLRAFLPGYADVEVAMAFTLSMQLCRLALGLAASLVAGAACASVATPSSNAPRVAAVVILVLFLPVHYALWDRFPLWYHAFFLLSLAPAVLGGAALQRKVASALSRGDRARAT